MRAERQGRLQTPLGRRHHALHARVYFDGHANSAAEGFENGFSNMMRIVTTQDVDVQCHLGVIDETLEKFVEQIDVELADPRAGKLNIVGEPGSAGKIHHHAR